MSWQSRGEAALQFRLGSFVLGLVLFVPGVLLAWLTGRGYEGSWERGGRMWAWIGCALSILFWTGVAGVYSVLVTRLGVDPLARWGGSQRVLMDVERWLVELSRPTGRAWGGDAQ